MNNNVDEVFKQLFDALIKFNELNNMLESNMNDILKSLDKEDLETFKNLLNNFKNKQTFIDINQIIKNINYEKNISKNKQ